MDHFAPLIIPRPAASPDKSEHAEYFSRYTTLVPGDDAMTVIEGQLNQTFAILRTISEETPRLATINNDYNETARVEMETVSCWQQDSRRNTKQVHTTNKSNKIQER